MILLVLLVAAFSMVPLFVVAMIADVVKPFQQLEKHIREQDQADYKRTMQAWQRHRLTGH